jgi:hypothetical protein
MPSAPGALPSKSGNRNGGTPLEGWHSAVSRQRRRLDAWGAARPEFWAAVKRLNARIPIPSERFIDRPLDKRGV